MEFAIKNVQIALRWDDEHLIGLDVQAFGDEFDGHLRVTGEDFMKESDRRSKVVDDNDRHTEIGW
jgi:hypothetical protein